MTWNEWPEHRLVPVSLDTREEPRNQWRCRACGQRWVGLPPERENSEYPCGPMVEVVRSDWVPRGQSLWLAMAGTKAVLVWATTEKWAIERTRRRAYDRKLSHEQVRRMPVFVHDVKARLATAYDLAVFADNGVKQLVPAGVGLAREPRPGTAVEMRRLRPGGDDTA